MKMSVKLLFLHFISIKIFYCNFTLFVGQSFDRFFFFFTISVIMHIHRDFIVLYMLLSFGFEKLFNNIINLLTKMYFNSILYF